MKISPDISMHIERGDLMNVVTLTGRLVQNAVVFGKDNETMKFTVASSGGYDSSSQEARVDYVPCVMFRAPEKLRQLLVAQGKGKPVELQGKVSTSSYEQQGVKRYATEVIVDARNFQLQRTGNSAASAQQAAGYRQNPGPQEIPVSSPPY